MQQLREEGEIQGVWKEGVCISCIGAAGGGTEKCKTHGEDRKGGKGVVGDHNQNPRASNATI